MYRIPVINQNERFLDLNEQPLVNGKVEILDPVSNNFLTIWSYSDDEYTVMTNPARLDIEGRVTQTIFCDRIVYVRVYKYLGRDENNHEIFEFIRDFYAGENENSESREYVVGIEDLKDLDPSVNSSVNVLGYFNAFDCPMRQYVWDATCSQDPDNGYVIASDVSSTGRWILVFSGEYLPSSYYGVYPGQIANINALMSYPEKVGTHLVPTAPGIWFVPGEYAVDTNLNTAKRVLLDANTQFDCNYFYCGNLTVKGEPQIAICDFDFRDPEQEAHSSWFRTMAGYLTCGAKKFIFDERDNFVNHTLQNANYALQNKIIEGQTRLPVTYNGDNCRITFNNCAINAERIFNSTDRLSFAYADIKDNWWNNPASVDWNSTVYARSSALNRIQLDNFTNVTAYVNAKVADGATFVDLAGREIGNLSFSGGLVELRNAYVTGNLFISKSGVDVWLKHVKCGYVNCTCRYITIEDNSDITFSVEPSFSAMWANNSKVYGNSFWTGHSKQIICKNCEVGFGLNWAQDNDFDHSYLEFTDCTFQENNSYYVKRIVMKRCVTNNNTIKIYPHKSNNIYYLGSVTLESNTFNNNNPVEFTKVDTINGYAQDNVYDCVAQWNITNNLFLGNTEGLRCRYWQHRTGSNYGKAFIATNKNVFSVVYEGNTGNCPATDMHGVYISDNQGYKKETVYAGSNSIDLYKYQSASKRVMPTGDNGNWWMETTKGPDTLIKYYSWVNSPYNSLTYDMFIHTNWFIYPLAHDDAVNNGDFFRMAIVSYSDYVRIVQRGDGDRNQGVIAKVI